MPRSRTPADAERFAAVAARIGCSVDKLEEWLDRNRVGAPDPDDNPEAMRRIARLLTDTQDSTHAGGSSDAA